MHVFKVAFYASGAYYALFVDRGLLVPFFAAVAIYLIISSLIGGKDLSTRKKIMLATWTQPSEGIITIKIPVRVDRLVKFLQSIPKENRPTITHYVIKAVGKLLTTQPQVNGKLVFGKFVQYQSVDVSCLVDIEGGKDLAVICVKGVDKMSVQDIASFIRGKASGMKRNSGGQEHKKKTKPFNLIPAFIVSVLVQIISFITTKLGLQIKALNMQKHSFGAACVTSLGMLGFQDATAPFSGFTNCVILASANAVHDAPVIEDGKVVVGKVMNVNFVADHRYLDGGKCTKMVPAFLRVLQQPEQYLTSSDQKQS